MRSVLHWYVRMRRASSKPPPTEVGNNASKTLKEAKPGRPSRDQGSASSSTRLHEVAGSIAIQVFHPPG
jgi:hypothetical protein